MTRRRGYLWLAAVLFVALLIVVFIVRSQRASSPTIQTQDLDSLALAAPLEQTHSQQSAKHHQYYVSSHYSQHSQVQADNPQQEQVSHTPTYHPKKRTIVELNSADSLDLVQLYNIGPSFARRILKYRALLGGFISKSQLLEVYGMDSSRYCDIAPYVTVDTRAVQPLDINTATIDQMKRHPYLDYYQAKAIVQLRQKAGPYHSIQDLRQISLIDNETYTKITPYLSCNSPQSK